MRTPTFSYKIKSLIIIFCLCLSLFAFAQGSKEEKAVNLGCIELREGAESAEDTTAYKVDKRKPSKEKNLTELQKQARLYRDEGLKLQKNNDFDGAMSFYQKAAELDSSYCVIYNDLGIIYEAKGWTERAKDCYLKAIDTDSHFLSAYSNLALLYEDKHDLEKAHFYWEKRLGLGSANDPWTQKAKQHLKDIRLIQQGKSYESKEQQAEVMELIKETIAQKSAKEKDDEAFGVLQK